MAFTPIFIDLVRNYTTTTGTGNLVLGSPPPGFKSFNSALKPGDSFYYSVIGLDNVSQSEVGRGTLDSDGSIIREAISGVPTDFAKGMKSVALVTAAEWYQGAAQKADVSAATEFSLAAPGAVQRSLRSKAADVISAKDFGAVGDGVRDDTAAIKAAVDHGASTGQPIFLPKGTYIVAPATLDFQGSGYAERFVLFGEGGSSVLKAKDGSINSSGQFMMRFITRQDMECIEVRDLVVDMNARGSPDPAVTLGNAWAYQQSHAFKIAPKSGTIKQVRFSNVVIKDPAADGFHFSTTETGRVLNYVVDNCAVTDRTRVRSDICLTSLPVSTIVTGFYGDVIEVEAEAAVPEKSRVHLSNVHVNRIDFATAAADYTTGNVEAYFDGVVAPEVVNFHGFMLRASNCAFGVSSAGDRHLWWCFQPGSQISDSLLLHKYDSGTNAVASLQIQTSATYGWRNDLRFTGCESRIDASGAIKPAGAAITATPGVPPEAIARANLEIVDHKFDSRFEASVYAYCCGTVRLAGNDYGGTEAAVKFRSLSGSAVDLSVEGGNFRRVTGASIGTQAAVVDQVTGIGYLRLTGDHAGVKTPWVPTSANQLPATTYNQLYSNRRMLMASLPASGVLGDIVELQAANAGAPDSYRCTAPGSPATYKARTGLAG